MYCMYLSIRYFATELLILNYICAYFWTYFVHFFHSRSLFHTHTHIYIFISSPTYVLCSLFLTFFATLFAIVIKFTSWSRIKWNSVLWSILCFKWISLRCDWPLIDMCDLISAANFQFTLFFFVSISFICRYKINFNLKKHILTHTYTLTYIYTKTDRQADRRQSGKNKQQQQKQK